MHHQGVSSFDVELVEIRGLRKLELSAFFNRGLRTTIDQLGEVDVFRVFGAAHKDVAGNELTVQVTAQVQSRVNRGTKILRIIQRHVVAANVESESTARRASDQRSTRGSYF